MSDPVTNVEIEDVLSSIRRLVSSEGRAADGTDGAARTQPQESAEKLVLTPAQRIDEATVPAAEASADDASAEDAAAGIEIEMPQAPSAQVHHRDAEDAEIIAEDEAGAMQAEPDLAVPEFLRRRPVEAQQGEAQQGEAEQGEGGAEAGALSESPDEPHSGQPAEMAGMTEPDAPAAQPLEGAAAAEMPPADGAAVEAGPEPAVDLAELEARVAEFEAAVAEQQDEWEPDGTGADDANAASPTETPAWPEADAGEAGGAPPEAGTMEPAPEETAASDSPGETTAPEQDSGDLWLAEDAVLDEDALRDMVAEIVRQELQGALGERITRNVRKLVRREINRALMSQGLD